MKDILFKTLFPSKHEEIMSLTKKLQSEKFFSNTIMERNTAQEKLIRQLRTDLYEIRDKEREYLQKQTEDSKQQYYKTLREKGIV